MSKPLTKEMRRPRKGSFPMCNSPYRRGSEMPNEKVSHTPGPWIFRRMTQTVELARLRGLQLAEHEGYFRENNGDWIISSENGRIAAATFKGKAKRGEGYAAPDSEGLANARLIAAAPDLLFALKELLYHTERKGDANKFLAVAKAENAIRKAEGR